MSMRQKLLVLYLRSPDLASQVGSWTIYDGTGNTRPTTGDSETPPYNSVLEAMQDGWRVIQFPQQWPAFPGTEKIGNHGNQFVPKELMTTGKTE